VLQNSIKKYQNQLETGEKNLEKKNLIIKMLIDTLNDLMEAMQTSLQIKQKNVILFKPFN
jgi:hypothetical protein